MEDVAQVLVEEVAKAADAAPAAVPEIPLQNLSGTGHIFLLIGLVCMAGSTAYFYMCAMQKSGDAQFFEGLTMMITGIATLAYLSMCSRHGYVFVHGRKLYYARYVDWILTTPLMVWDVLALAGAPSSEILMTVGIDMLMIGFGVVGGATPGYKKWIFWALGCMCFMHVVGVLMKYMSVDKFGAAAKKLYGQVAWLTIVLWTFYPVVWVLAEGGHIVSCTIEAGLYMVLDVLSKCMFGFVIVSSRGALDNVVNEKAGYNAVA